jgi:hypothetical protein
MHGLDDTDDDDADDDGNDDVDDDVGGNGGGGGGVRVSRAIAALAERTLSDLLRQPAFAAQRKVG